MLFILIYFSSFQSVSCVISVCVYLVFMADFWAVSTPSEAMAPGLTDPLSRRLRHRRSTKGRKKGKGPPPQTWESTSEVDFNVSSRIKSLCLPSSRFCLAPFVSCEVDFTTKNVSCTCSPPLLLILLIFYINCLNHSPKLRLSPFSSNTDYQIRLIVHLLKV